MVAYLFRMPSGVRGDITRQEKTIVESALINEAATPAETPQAFGVPIKFVNGYIEAIQAGDTASDFAGVLTRLAPSISGDVNDETFLEGTPNKNSVQGIVVEGYINVTCPLGTPVRNEAVYMRIVESLPNLVGDFEATSVPGENVLLTDVVWAVNGKDSDDLAEIRVSI